MSQITMALDDVSDAPTPEPLPGDEKKTISRILLQRIMTSASAQYLDKNTYDKLSRCFLSEAPDEGIDLMYREKDSVHNAYSYYGNICSLTVSWNESGNYFKDIGGNVWGSYHLSVMCGTHTSRSLSASQFAERADCISAVRALASEMEAMVPGPIRFMKMTNAQRIEKETKEKYEEACMKLHQTLVWGGGRVVRRGLRVSGNLRAFDRELVKGIEPGIYVVVVNAGSSRTPRNRQYSVTIPERESFRPYIKRVS